MKKLWLLNRTFKSYIFISLLLIFTVFVCFAYWIKVPQKYETTIMEKQVFSEVNLKQAAFKGARIVHLDLKGAPPKIAYLKKMFSLFSKLGATGLLVEYEDMFPYNTNLARNVSALNCYTIEEIKEINSLAKKNNLDIIPLIQTFGHLEFLLKLQEYKEFREMHEYPQTICPTHGKTIDLLMEMIEQILEMHPFSNYLHIGADEVYYLGVCERCTAIMSQLNLSKNLLFIRHINELTNRIHKKYPHLRILMWDDEFRSFSVKELKNINKFIEPVVWKYTKEVYDELGPSLWEMYAEVFSNVWVASAFKGATGSNQYVSDVTHYVQNHRSWLSLINEYKNDLNFNGIILTGWQRYDHFAVLCELLPVSLPSLAMCLRVIDGYNDSPLSPPLKVAELLGCKQPYGLIGSVFGTPQCTYPGYPVLELVLRLQQLKQEFDTILEDSRIKGWMNDYNINNRFSNPLHVSSVTAPLNRIRDELMDLNNDLYVIMWEIYDNFTISEWRQTFVKPFEREVEKLWIAKQTILDKDSWPRRPLTDEF